MNNLSMMKKGLFLLEKLNHLWIGFKNMFACKERNTFYKKPIPTQRIRNFKIKLFSKFKVIGSMTTASLPFRHGFLNL